MAEESCWEIGKDYDRNRDLLGRGGYGAVFKGELIQKADRSIKKPVAIKRIDKAMLINGTTYPAAISVNRELIQKELNHPNVVKFLYVDEDDQDFLYFALELCDASLDRVYLPENHPKKYKGPLPNDADFMLQLSLGLEYIHSQKLVHRDIKPENVLISTSTRKVTMKWADFGLSKATTSGGEFVLSGGRGTANYWAPEIFDRVRKMDRSIKVNDADLQMTATVLSDIFSCGCVFYWYLTKGTHPFGSDVDSPIMNLLQSNPKMNFKDLPPNHFAYNIICKMLSNKEEERLNLREIIPLLASICRIDKMDGTDQLKKAAYEKMIRDTKNLYRLCSMTNPNENAIQELSKIVTQDSIGLVNVIDENGNSPFLLLCENNKSASLLWCIELMTINNHKLGRQGDATNLRRGLDVTYLNRKGSNALHYVCMNYQGENLIDIIKLLVDHGIDVNRTERKLAENALQLILKYSRGKRDLFEIVKFMLLVGVDLMHKNKKGATTLMYLCRYYNHSNLLDLLRFMIDKGAEVTTISSDGWNAFMSLCECYTSNNNLIEVVRYFVDKGIDVKAKNSYGMTAFHYLCWKYNNYNLIKLTKFLVKKGIDVNAKASDGWTPLHCLCKFYTQNNLIDLVRLLIQKGADVTIKKVDGCTALDLLRTNAKYKNNSNLIQLLGGNPNAERVCAIL